MTRKLLPSWKTDEEDKHIQERNEHVNERGQKPDTNGTQSTVQPTIYNNDTALEE